MNSLFRQKLTRALLLELPDGAYVISNVTDGSMPVFAVRIREDVPRQQLWLQARRVRADGRLCWISSNPSEVRHLFCFDLLPATSDELNSERQRQLADITASGDADNAECAAADLAREFPATR